MAQRQSSQKRKMTVRRDNDILSIGRQMSNICWNLGHNNAVSIEASRGTYAELAKQWDEAVIKYRESFKRRRRP